MERLLEELEKIPPNMLRQRIFILLQTKWQPLLCITAPLILRCIFSKLPRFLHESYMYTFISLWLFWGIPHTWILGVVCYLELPLFNRISKILLQMSPGLNKSEHTLNTRKQLIWKVSNAVFGVTFQPAATCTNTYWDLPMQTRFLFCWGYSPMSNHVFSPNSQ